MVSSVFIKLLTTHVEEAVKTASTGMEYRLFVTLSIDIWHRP